MWDTTVARLNDHSSLDLVVRPRRSVLKVLMPFGVAAAGSAGAARSTVAQPAVDRLAAMRDDWLAFKQLFLARDGRVIDTGNNGVSHSEGQGYGLLFAVALDDSETFDRILSWTVRNLRCREDQLHAWRFVPAATTPVSDHNNATDGDILIAASMLRAARKWRRPDQAIAAAQLARDIRRILVRAVVGRLVLLPGAYGFDSGRSVLVNPSYYIFRLIRELASVDVSPIWQRLEDEGLRMIADARFGLAELPSDWIDVSGGDGSLSPAQSFPPRFSYDAVRIPLNLAWAGLKVPSFHAAYEEFCKRGPRLPAWVDLGNNVVSPYDASSGMVAISIFARSRERGTTLLNLPALHAGQDYYSAAMTLLTRIAENDLATTMSGGRSSA